MPSKVAEPPARPSETPSMQQINNKNSTPRIVKQTLQSLHPYAILASIVAFLVQHTFTNVVVYTLDVILNLNLSYLAAGITTCLLCQGKDEAAASICLTADAMNKPEVVHKLGLELIKRGKIREVARVSTALWQYGTPSPFNKNRSQLAHLLSPVAISALEEAKTPNDQVSQHLANLQIELVKTKHAYILTDLVTDIVETRTQIAMGIDLAAAAIMDGGPAGSNAVVEVSSQLIQGGHTETAARLGSALYKSVRKDAKLKVGCVLAGANDRAIGRGHLHEAVDTVYSMYATYDGVEAVCDAFTCMIKYLQRPDTVSAATCLAIDSGRGDMVAAVSECVLVKGRADVAAAANEASYNKCTDKAAMCDVTAQAMSTAYDKGSIDTLVTVNRYLWERGCLGLLRDTVLALDRINRPDVSGAISWRSMERNITLEAMVVDISVSLIKGNHIKPAATTLTHTIQKSHDSNDPRATPCILDVASTACLELIQRSKGGQKLVALLTEELLRQKQDKFVAEFVARLAREKQEEAVVDVGFEAATTGQVKLVPDLVGELMDHGKGEEVGKVGKTGFKKVFRKLFHRHEQ